MRLGSGYWTTILSCAAEKPAEVLIVSAVLRVYDGASTLTTLVSRAARTSSSIMVRSGNSPLARWRAGATGGQAVTKYRRAIHTFISKSRENSGKHVRELTVRIKPPFQNLGKNMSRLGAGLEIQSRCGTGLSPYVCPFRLMNKCVNNLLKLSSGYCHRYAVRVS